MTVRRKDQPWTPRLFPAMVRTTTDCHVTQPRFLLSLQHRPPLPTMRRAMSPTGSLSSLLGSWLPQVMQAACYASRNLCPPYPVLAS